MKALSLFICSIIVSSIAFSQGVTPVAKYESYDCGVSMGLAMTSPLIGFDASMRLSKNISEYARLKRQALSTEDQNEKNQYEAQATDVERMIVYSLKDIKMKAVSDAQLIAESCGFNIED